MRLSILLYILVKSGAITEKEADKVQSSGLGDMIIPDNWREVEQQIIKKIKEL